MAERQQKQWKGLIGGRGDDPKRGLIDRVTQLDAVPEEHIYLISKAGDGTMILWQADLLGDRTPDTGHGRLPPVIHMFCPFCATAEDPRPISITFENKPFEIERLRVPETLDMVAKVDGTMGPVQLTHHLHIRDVLQCPYTENVQGERCGARFTIRSSRIERAY